MNRCKCLAYMDDIEETDEYVIWQCEVCGRVEKVLKEINKMNNEKYLKKCSYCGEIHDERVCCSSYPKETKVKPDNKTWEDSTLDKIVEVLIRTHCPDCMCETDGKWLMGDEPELAILEIIKQELATQKKQIYSEITEKVTERMETERKRANEAKSEGEYKAGKYVGLRYAVDIIKSLEGEEE